MEYRKEKGFILRFLRCSRMENGQDKQEFCLLHDSLPGFVRKMPALFGHKDHRIYAVDEAGLEVCIKKYALSGINLGYAA